MVRLSDRLGKPRRVAMLAIGLAGLGIGGPACGQPAAIPPEVAAKVRALGPVLNDEVRSSARSLYTPLQPKIGPDILVRTDVAYGSDERHKLDLLAPVSKPLVPVPVVIFVHGGAYVRGNKSVPRTPFYQNIAAFWVRHSMIGVNITYRLAPKHQWPAGAQDVGAALKWVRNNIGEYGGDPSRIVLMGHSAGASHIAGYLFHKELWPSGGDGVIAAILLSGGYDPESGQTEGRRAYYGEDQGLYAQRLPLRHIASRAVPIFIGFAEYDPPRFQLEAIGLFKALCERDNRCPPLKQLLGHNHLTQVYHIGTTDDSLTADLLAFVRGLK
jgi:acetyl esterase/lipase